MDPDNLDMLLCLRMNDELWSAQNVEDIIMKKQRGDSHNGTATAEIIAENLFNYYTTLN